MNKFTPGGVFGWSIKSFWAPLILNDYGQGALGCHQQARVYDFNSSLVKMS
jgi:hypothetical protein